MTRKPLFWIIAVVFTALCLVFTLTYFKEAFSILNLDIEMDRETALIDASKLMDRFSFGPHDYTQAIVFNDNAEFQSYVELEAGGKDAYQKIIDDRIFRPFTWVVRHFKESQTNETSISFTPEGQPYEFVEKLPEDQAGASLESDEARLIAENMAGEHWSIALSDYVLVETSQKSQPSGRLDHTFVYERPDQKVGEAPCRLKLVTGGDRLVEVDHYYQIPEAFQRKYSEMRSANNTIAMVAFIALAILYILGGCVIGLFILMKKNFVLWKQPLFWGFLVSFISVLGQVNFLPLTWMDYDTALSSRTFILGQVLQFVSTFIFDGLLLVVSFMAAESLTRLAFPHHIQLWRTWSVEVGPTKAVLGRTVSAYFLIICFLAYEVALQFFGKAIPGWWSPASALTDPNILASFLPWFTPISISLHAGFWEECLFRAVPLAGAALIGQRIGRRRTCIIIAMIIQAFIFGGGHANYPAQPSFARVLELIIPSLTFGSLYLMFGLLPAIIMHYAFDVVMMSIPLFAARGLWVDKAMTIIFVLAPLWVILWRRLQARSWTDVPQRLFNAGWKPAPAQEKTSTVASVYTGLMPKNALVSVTIIGVLGFSLLLFLKDFQQLSPTLHPDRSTARSEAMKEMTSRDGFAMDQWKALTRLEANQSTQHRFIWQEGGRELYQKLLGTYLETPHWVVRFARFQGDLAERAEEYLTVFRSDGPIRGIFHVLPQARNGTDLSQEEASELVLRHVNKVYDLESHQLEAVSAISKKQPNRRDWTFTYAVPDDYPLSQGQARIEVVLGGDEITSFKRYIFVPEEWERQERQHQQANSLAQAPFQILGALLLVALSILSMINWSKKRFSVTTFVRFYGLLAALVILSFINSWPAKQAYFSTAEPLTNQTLTQIAFLVAPLLGFAFLAMILGFLQYVKRRQPPASSSQTWLAALAITCLVAGLSALLERLVPSMQAPWPSFSAANCFIPAFQPLFMNVQYFIIATVLILAIICSIDYVSRAWSQRRPLAVILFLIAGFVIMLAKKPDSMNAFFAGGLLSFLVLLLAYLLVFRYHLSLIPLTITAILVVQTVSEISAKAFSNSITAHVVAIVGLLIVGYCWFNWLNKPDQLNN